MDSVRYSHLGRRTWDALSQLLTFPALRICCVQILTADVMCFNIPSHAGLGHHFCFIHFNDLVVLQTTKPWATKAKGSLTMFDMFDVVAGHSNSNAAFKRVGNFFMLRLSTVVKVA